MVLFRDVSRGGERFSLSGLGPLSSPSAHLREAMLLKRHLRVNVRREEELDPSKAEEGGKRGPTL